MTSPGPARSSNRSAVLWWPTTSNRRDHELAVLRLAQTDLRNCIALDPCSAPAIEVDGESLSRRGQGSGLLGLPGDFSPLSRFVRAAVSSALAIAAVTVEAGVEQAFDIRNTFDIPGESIRAESDGQVHTDSTPSIAVRDPANGRHCLRTHGDQTLPMVDLAGVDSVARLGAPGHRDPRCPRRGPLSRHGQEHGHPEADDDHRHARAGGRVAEGQDVLPINSRMTITDGAERQLAGSLLEKDCSIAAGRRPVAQITRKWATVRDACVLDVAEGVDVGLALALPWAVDRWVERD